MRSYNTATPFVDQPREAREDALRTRLAQVENLRDAMRRASDTICADMPGADERLAAYQAAREAWVHGMVGLCTQLGTHLMVEDLAAGGLTGTAAGDYIRAGRIGR